MIEIRDLRVRQGGFRLDLDHLRVEEGVHAVLMGPSGSGKTTLLEVLCGLRVPLSGSVRLSGLDVTRLRPGERGVGYLPQDRALFPGLRVEEQIGFALHLRRLPSDRIRERVREVARLTGTESLLTRFPHQLSGGEAQRVALGRAIAARPRILLLDEPLGALDQELRQAMGGLLRQVHRETGATVLHVTHDREEARRLGDLHLAMEALCRVPSLSTPPESRGHAPARSRLGKTGIGPDGGPR